MELTQTITVNGASVTVRNSTNRTAAIRSIIQRALLRAYPALIGNPVDEEMAAKFSVIASQIIIAEGTLRLPTAGDTDEQIAACFEAWKDDAPDLWNDVWIACFNLDAPKTDATEKPPETLTDEEKNDPKSRRRGANS